jgi:flagellar biosynthesis protein FlhG
MPEFYRLPRRAAPPPAAASAGNNLIVIASGKGGVGKTWFAVSLAQALAGLKRKVLLFDGDLGLANVDIQLGLSPSKDLGNYIEGSASLRGVIHPYSDGGFDIIAGRSGIGSLATLPSQQLNQLRADLLALARNYHDVLIDLGAGIDRTVRNLAGPARLCLVVTNGEPTSLTDAYAFIKVIHGAVPTQDLRVVVNTASDPSEGRRTYETLLKACENFLKFSPGLAGVVRRDSKVPQSIRRQTSLLTRWPGSDAAIDVSSIAEQVAKRKASARGRA